ncbi:MAG TPA: hypothetical protein VIF15_22465 [Polyangiaceae bacterium]|jgi:hypothetical protein
MTAFPGTERLGRPLTDQEKADLAALLRAHDYVGARMAALRFASSRTGSLQAAQDLVGRVDARLLQWGWDPHDCPLKKRMCRMVWSVWTHELEASKAAERAAEMYLREEEAVGPEGKAAALRRKHREHSAELAELESLRASFLKAKDEVNLLWINYQLQGIEEPAEMARLSRRDVKEFYRATDRRKRHTDRLLAAQRGVKDNEEDA